MKKTKAELQAEVDDLKARLSLSEQVIARLLAQGPAPTIVPMPYPVPQVPALPPPQPPFIIPTFPSPYYGSAVICTQ